MLYLSGQIVVVRGDVWIEDIPGLASMWRTLGLRG
jgi:hypothetical protein